MKALVYSALIPLSVFLAGRQAVAETETFGLDPATPTDTVRFASTARLEFVEGTTTNITGGVRFDPDNTAGQVSGRLAVDLRSLETGIGLRDRHMRERHLHTEKYPLAYFELTGLSNLPPQLATDSMYAVDVTGIFYLHGIRRDLLARADVALISVQGEGRALKVKADFLIRLEDYDIPRPKALFLKLAEEVEVVTVFTAYLGVQPDSLELPDWPQAQDSR